MMPEVRRSTSGRKMEYCGYSQIETAAAFAIHMTSPFVAAFTNENLVRFCHSTANFITDYDKILEFRWIRSTNFDIRVPNP